MTLTEKWETHNRCDGTGMLNNVINGDNSRPDAFDEWPCPDCVDGLVPPEGMIEAAARGWLKAEDWLRSEDDVLRFDEEVDEYDLGFARAALVAAKRWEKKE